MKKIILSILLVFVLCVQASASQLSDAAALLTAGQWSPFISVSGGAAQADDITYMDSAVWDSTARKMYFTQMGEHGADFDTGTAVWIYDEATNALTRGAKLSSVLPTVAGASGYHAYDANAWDPRNQKLYFHIDNQIASFIYDTGSPPAWGPTDFVYDPIANTWTGITPSAAKRAQDANSCCDAMAFFPERRGFYQFSVGFTTNVWFYNVDTGVWSAIAKIGVGSTWMIMEYNAVCRCIILIDNGTRTVRRINLDGSITAMANVPGAVSMYDGSGFAGSFVADPMSRNFLMYSTGGANGPDTAWRYDPIADTWTSAGTPPIASPNQGGMASTPIPELGVMATFSCGTTATCTNAKILLYKMTTSTAGDQDYAKRCNQKGVTTCQPFNTLGTDYRTADVVRLSSDTTHGNLRASGGDQVNGTYFGSVDNGVKLSGAGSLKFQLPAGGSAANIAGQYLAGGSSAIPDPWTGLGGNFGPSTDWYVQYAFRFSPEYLTNIANFWGIQPKISIFHHDGLSCASKELTVRNWDTSGSGMIMMYKDCGGASMVTALDGFTWKTTSPPYLFQQGDLACAYPGTGNCFAMQANKWITLYFKVHNGTWGSNNSTIEAWYAVDGAAYVKWLNVTANFTIDCDSSAPPCTSETFNNITLTPFMTGLSTSAPVDAFIWYDELIASRSPIAAPGQAAGEPEPPIPTPTNPVSFRISQLKQ